jgi:parvulin-like peptidyl-prolyl isomerase
MKPGTPAYQLAKDLAATLPELDPEANTVLIQTDTFTLTTSEVIKSILDNRGTQIATQLKAVAADQLKNILMQSAERAAETKLLLEAAAAAGSSIDPQVVEDTLQLQYQRLGGKEGFLELLAKQGIELDHVKANIQNDLLIEHYLEGLMENQGAVSEEEIQAAYAADKTASVRHILLLTQGKTDAEKVEIHKKMEELLTRARNGEDFAALAKEFTEDPGSKDNGGLYEDFGRGRMVKPFEEAAFTVPVGEISDIVETQFGYHILKIVNRKQETRPLEDVRAELEQQVLQRKQSEIYRSEVKKLKQKRAYEVVGF